MRTFISRLFVLKWTAQSKFLAGPSLESKIDWLIRDYRIITAEMITKEVEVSERDGFPDSLLMFVKNQDFPLVKT